MRLLDLLRPGSLRRTRPSSPPAPAGPPRGELGEPVALRLDLVRAPRAIVIMRGAVAYSTGLEFDTDIVGRDDLDLREGLVFQLHQRVGLGRRIPRKLVRLGVAFADGRRATSLDFLSPAEPDGERAAALTLVCQRGGGSGRRWRLSWWLAPLPPEGPVTVECEWPWSEVPASRQTFDAGPLREAAERSERF